MVKFFSKKHEHYKYTHIVSKVKSQLSTCMSINVLVTTNVNAQFRAVAKEAAVPRIRLGKTSPIISQGIGPKPMEKLTT